MNLTKSPTTAAAGTAVQCEMEDRMARARIAVVIPSYKVTRHILGVIAGMGPEVTRIYGDVYGRDPEFYAFFRTLESYSKSIGSNTTLMVRASSELYKYLQDISVRRQ